MTRAARLGQAVVHSRALLAMVAPEVAVEVHLSGGLPACHLVGLPQAEVRESRDRVRAAIEHLGFEFPAGRVTVNLAPADLPKDSGRFDLPIALGILCASGQLEAGRLAEFEAVGELSLTGELRPIRGAIAMALAVRRAGQNRTLLLPQGNAADAALIRGVGFEGVRSLAQAARLFAGKLALPEPVQRWAQAAGVAAGSSVGSSASVPPNCPADPPSSGALAPDLADVRGHRLPKRALEIAAAGGHSLLRLWTLLPCHQDFANASHSH